MGALAFISSLAQALAWPAAAVILALLFKDKLTEGLGNVAALIKRTKTFSYGRARITFAKEIAADRELAANVLAANRPLFPRLEAHTVPGSWGWLNLTINQAADLLGISEGMSFDRQSAAVINELHKRGALSSPDAALSLVQSLQRLQEAVDGGLAVNELEAYDYASVAREIAGLLLDAEEKATGKTRVSAIGLTNLTATPPFTGYEAAWWPRPGRGVPYTVQESYPNKPDGT